MASLEPMEREDLSLQADPVLMLSDGRATFGQKLFISIVAIVIVLGTLYALAHQGGSTRSPQIVAVSGAVIPDTVGRAK